LAALVTGRTDLQRFLHLPGLGGTGKGTFTRLARALVGERNTAATDLRSLEKNQFESATLYGMRLALITDSDKYGRSVNVLKALTAEDAIRLERKHVQQHGTFVFRGLVLIASNEPLATTDLTSGLEHRRITVTFGRRATDTEREAWRKAGGEQAVLHRELPGVLNWVLELDPEQVSKIISAPPVRTQTANLDALTAGNPVAGWLVETCAPRAGVWTQIGVREERRDPVMGASTSRVPNRVYTRVI
jgi:putative DNA primase/helicase